MKNKAKKGCFAELDERIQWFVAKCRESGLKITPQRTAIYKELIKTDKHPSAKMLYTEIRKVFPSISLDTVNRTLLMFAEMGAAFVVEGSGDAKRFDGSLEKHQHFRCIKCRRIIDFHHKPFDDVQMPRSISTRFKVLKKTVYFEGICDLCMEKGDS